MFPSRGGFSSAAAASGEDESEETLKRGVPKIRLIPEKDNNSEFERSMQMLFDNKNNGATGSTPHSKIITTSVLGSLSATPRVSSGNGGVTDNRKVQ